MAQIHQGDALPFIKVPRIQTRVVAGEQTGTEEMTVWEQWMEPDGFIPIHYHDTEEVLFIVEGTVRLELADSFLECVAPASITVSAYELHGLSPTGNTRIHLFGIFPTSTPKIFDPEGNPRPLPIQDTQEQ